MRQASARRRSSRFVDVERERAGIERRRRGAGRAPPPGIAPGGELTRCELDRFRDARPDGLTQASPQIREIGGLHADEGHLLGRFAAQLREGENVVEPRLMGTHLERTPCRHLGVAQHPQAAGREPEVDRIEHQDAPRCHDGVEQIYALGAAIEHGDRFGKRVACVQSLDRAHAKAFVSPKEVADTQRQRLAADFHLASVPSPVTE